MKPSNLQCVRSPSVYHLAVCLLPARGTPGAVTTKARRGMCRNHDSRKTQHFRGIAETLQLPALFVSALDPARYFVALEAMKILVTGVTGAIGPRLARRLVADGHEVVVSSRRYGVPVPDGCSFVAADVVTGAGLARALEGVEVAYYLIHSMEPSAHGAFPALERAGAEHFSDAAVRAGVRRTIYLGGLIPEDRHASPHLASRLNVERQLLETAPDPVAFRASIVIGAQSRSFRFLVHLIERMPVLILPAWRDHVTAPIDIRDAIDFLARAATVPEVGGKSLDITGPDIVSYGDLIKLIRDHMLLGRPVLGLPRLTLTPIASRVSATIAGEEYALIGPLMDGLDSDLLPRDDTAVQLLGVRRHSLDSAIERALREWEASEPLKAR
jgi:uncharacterized protein YbjT (DUF2867 family)